MTPRLLWEAAVCTNPKCRSTVIHKIHREPKLHEDGKCPACEQFSLRLVRNETIVASLVMQATV